MPKKYLPVAEILAILQETPLRLAILSAGLSSAQLRTAPEPGEWSASELLAHLRACSDVWGDNYIMTILAQENPTIKAVNPKITHLEGGFSLHPSSVFENGHSPVGGGWRGVRI